MEITIKPAFQVSWKVKSFFQLSRETGSSLDSPDFLFNGDRYCIRLYPEVYRPSGNDTQYLVRRLSSNFTEREVSCEIGLQRRERNGDESCEYSAVSFEQICFITRSWIENHRDVYVPDGSLTMVCYLGLESRAGSSAPGEEYQGEFPGHNARFSTRWSSHEMDLTTESPCTRVQLIVHKFLELSREEVDSLASPEFRFAGDTFCLRFGRNADTDDTDLQLVRITSTFTDRTVFSRVGYGTMASQTYPHSARSLVGTTGSCVSRSELAEDRLNCIRCGSLYVVLFLHLGDESNIGAGISAAQKRGELTDINRLQSDYGQLLQKGTESDACVFVSGKEFRVHRAVLRARSTMFEAMFGHDTAEKESGRVVIDDFDPDVFAQFLEYLYAGHVGAGLSDDNAFGLYAVADKYDVLTLKSKCVEHMRENLSVDSFCDVATLALRHREEYLLQHVIRFFKDNMQDILVTAEWQQFMCGNPTGANELFMKAIVPGTGSLHL